MRVLNLAFFSNLLKALKLVSANNSHLKVFWLANFTGGMLSVEDQFCLADVHSLPIRTAEESKSWPVSVLVCINWVLSELISQQTGFILGYVKFPYNAQLHFLVLS